MSLGSCASFIYQKRDTAETPARVFLEAPYQGQLGVCIGTPSGYATSRVLGGAAGEKRTPMFYEIDPSQLLKLMLIAVPVHLAWGLLSRKWHPLYLLAIVLLILAPFSIAVDSAPIIVALKYARAYAGFLLVATGLLMLLARGARLGRASVALMAFSLFFWGSGAWSQEPATALLDHSRYLLLVVAGLTMGLSLRSRMEFMSSMRVLFFGSCCWAVLIILGISLGHFEGGRLAMFGMNANQVGMTSGFTFLVALALTINDRRAFFRIAALVCCGIIAVGAMLTGSRAAVAATIIGASPLLMPLVRRPLLLFGLIVFAAVLGYAASDLLIGEAGVERLGSLDNTRAAVWSRGYDYFLQSPVIGHGSMARGTGIYKYDSAFDPHSIYLAVLLTCGVVGALVFTVSMGTIGLEYLRAIRLVSIFGATERWPVYFGLSILLAALVNGVFESAPLGGVTIHTLAIGLSVGLVDWVQSPRFSAGSELTAQSPSTHSGTY